MLILNCGGTFNKQYNPITGNLDVAFDNKAVEKILESSTQKYSLAGIIYKDSLDMDAEDRKMIANIIKESTEKKFLIVHGTDTMDLTAEFLSEIFSDKSIVLTGAMRPFSIDPIEASFNLGMAIGFLNNSDESGVFLCMSGYVRAVGQIEKNRDLGRFEVVK